MTRRFIRLRTQAHLLIQAASVRHTKPASGGSRPDSVKRLERDHTENCCKRTAGCNC
jgi:hypothetical protein